MTVVGIDPGITGSVAFASDMGCMAYPMPVCPVNEKTNEVDVWALSALLDDVTGDDLVVVEEVGTNPSFGAQRAFNFGKTFGQILSVVRLKRLPLLLVKPKLWKDAMLKGTDRSKDAAVAKVNGLYPSLRLLKKDHDKAEAILMALYGRQTLHG
jgi:hypothetical protein